MDYQEAFSSQERLVIDAYISLMLQKPYDKISVKEIAACSGIARTAFYRLFEDSFDLLECIERYLLGELVLYRPRMAAGHDSGDAPAGEPFSGIEHWFATGIRLRPLLKGVMGENGDLYFKERLIKRLKVELGQMMDDECIPRDIARPYYVAAIAAAYIGLLNYVAVLESDADLLPLGTMVEIANSMRVAYFKAGNNPPPISNEKLFGAVPPQAR